MQVQHFLTNEINELHDDEAITYFLEESNAIEGVFDEKSLKNAITAWRYLVAQPKLDGGVILHTHKLLMKNQPIEPNQRGHWRTCTVYIGGREGLNWHSIPDAIAQWLQVVDWNVKAKNLESWRMSHVSYEHIHPFIDGNGRTGRMFLNWQRLKMGLPLLLITDADKRHYYQWFI